MSTFFAYDIIALKMLTSLGMADDHCLHAKPFEHIRGDRPVYGPLSFQNISCAPRRIVRPIFLTASRNTNGGHTTTAVPFFIFTCAHFFCEALRFFRGSNIRLPICNNKLHKLFSVIILFRNLNFS